MKREKQHSGIQKRFQCEQTPGLSLKVYKLFLKTISPIWIQLMGFLLMHSITVFTVHWMPNIHWWAVNGSCCEAFWHGGTPKLLYYARSQCVACGSLSHSTSDLATAIDSANDLWWETTHPTMYCILSLHTDTRQKHWIKTCISRQTVQTRSNYEPNNSDKASQTKRESKKWRVSMYWKVMMAAH